MNGITENEISSLALETDNAPETTESAESISDLPETEAPDAEKNAEIKTNTEAQISQDAEEGVIDYDKVISEDIAALKSEFPELRDLSDITELDNPIRYAALRDLGLSPTEAYLATTKRTRRDNRSHLTTAYGKNATPPVGLMSQRELAEAREVFGDLGDLEIQRLYKRVKERN